jgi:hypothetical protein
MSTFDLNCHFEWWMIIYQFNEEFVTIFMSTSQEELNDILVNFSWKFIDRREWLVDDFSSDGHNEIEETLDMFTGCLLW